MGGGRVDVSRRKRGMKGTRARVAAWSDNLSSGEWFRHKGKVVDSGDVVAAAESTA